MVVFHRFRHSALSALGALAIAACAGSSGSMDPAPSPQRGTGQPDPRVGLSAGLTNAGEAISNLRLLANTRPPERFVGVTNSDLAFKGNYAIQGNYNGILIWDISNPRNPTLVTSHFCPASQNDVSVYQNLLFVSAEAYNGRVDCTAAQPGDPQMAPNVANPQRFRGVRIFDISDIRNPKLLANVQTCRGSHTHTVLADPQDPQNIYIYVSGSAPVRPQGELATCIAQSPEEDPNSALFRIEVIRVPLANPSQASVVATPRFFQGLAAPPTHGEAEEDIAAAARVADSVRRAGGFTARVQGMEIPLGPGFVRMQLDSIVRARGGSGDPAAADTATFRREVQTIVDRIVGTADPGSQVGPDQCHDITVYPALGLAGGACEGYGILLDIRNPTNPTRLAAVADSNFSYWHSATFNNDGTKVIFTDEWGGGGGPKCRANDKPEWGANAIFAIENNRLVFKSYYKMPAAQTAQENCVAHNGSLIPIPGRDIMVQAWYQGGISIFEFTDPANPKEIAYHDRGPINAQQMASGGSWSAYWYNGAIISSEIARGLDIFELTPSEHLTQNEIDAAKTVRLDYLNPQGQPKLSWPPSFALARAYVDQLERSRCLSTDRIAAVRQGLNAAERMSGGQRQTALNTMVSRLEGDARNSCDAPKVRMLMDAVRGLSAAM